MKRLYISFNLLALGAFVFASPHKKYKKGEKKTSSLPLQIKLKPNSSDLEVLQEAREETHNSVVSLYSIKNFGRPYVRLGKTGFPESVIDVAYIQKVIPWLNYVYASPVAQSLYVEKGVFQQQAFLRDVRSVAVLVSRTQKFIGKEIHTAPFIKSQTPIFFAIQEAQLAKRNAKSSELDNNPMLSDDAATRAKRDFFSKD